MVFILHYKDMQKNIEIHFKKENNQYFGMLK